MSTETIADAKEAAEDGLVLEGLVKPGLVPRVDLPEVENGCEATAAEFIGPAGVAVLAVQNSETL